MKRGDLVRVTVTSSTLGRRWLNYIKNNSTIYRFVCETAMPTGVLLQHYEGDQEFWFPTVNAVEIHVVNPK